MDKLGRLILILLSISLSYCMVIKSDKTSLNNELFVKNEYAYNKHILFLFENNKFLYRQAPFYVKQYSFGDYDIIEDTLILNSLYNNGETEITVNEYLNPDKKSSRIRVYCEDDFSKEISACVLLNDSVFYPTGCNYVFPKAVHTIQFYDTIHGIFSQIYKVKDTLNNEFSVQIKYSPEIYQHSVYGDNLYWQYVFFDNYKLIVQEGNLVSVSKLKNQKQVFDIELLKKNPLETLSANYIIDEYFREDKKLKSWIYSLIE